ncbi:helix-turn-helix domain-containing protein [Aureimonas sp. ME7]|uniref:helix-turn-helix domain-containing protein n=1 Tax=Aureimonas sp. ME7 TaxID=2744252 RepID=UPI0015F6931D|nr:helix-turn-helix domain-containing protein [Aureimonas sp. ME7]
MANHHYTESGLDNVFLEGMLVEVDDDGDDIITIPAINELHKAIALGIVTHEKGMSGSELRFLRTELGMTQSEFAVFVHRDKQTIGRWERGETEMEGVIEAAIRQHAIQKLELPFGAGIEELSSMSVPSAETQPIRITANDGGHAGYALAA